MELKVSPINQLPIHINIIDIFKIAEIKNAAAEAQKFATTVKELNAVCEKYGFTSLDEFLEKAEDYKNGNALDSGSKKTKSGKRKAVNVGKAPKTTRKRSVITQEMVEKMAKDCAAAPRVKKEARTRRK